MDTEIAVVGIGDWGQNLVRTFDDLAAVRRCVHTGTPDNARRLATEHGIEATTDYGAVLADDAVDAVAVATPIPTLADLVERALRADKHVYVEKPMAATFGAARRLAALAADRDRRLFVGYVFVHHPVVARLRERLDGRDPDYLRLEWNRVGSFGSDLVADVACHPVSVTIDLFDRLPDAVDVTARASAAGDTDVLSARLGYGDAACDLHVDRVSPLVPGVSGTAVVDREAYFFDDDGLRRLDPEAGTYRPVYERDAEPLATECRAFLHSLDTGVEPTTDGGFGVRVHRVLERLREGA